MNAFDRIVQTARSRKLCKDPDNGLVFGVCAGLGWWLGVKVWAVRLVALLALVIWTGPTLIAYLIAALVLNKRPAARYDRYRWQEERFGRFGRDTSW